MEWDGLEKLIAAAGAAIAAALTPVGVIYTATINRKSRASEATITSLTESLERAEERLEASEKLLETEKREGLRWYQLVQIWFDHAHDMRRDCLDARQEAENLARIAKLPAPQWTKSIQLPLMEDPLPRKTLA
jgi:hypothetical protein